jgi:predicted DNA-binding protein (MmcQ/YjbR family)
LLAPDSSSLVFGKPLGSPSLTSTTARAGAELRKLALRYPQAHEDFPWGEHAFKVKKKVFLFMRYDASLLSLSLKLPLSQTAALMFPFAEPTGYGLGKAGWVSARFAKGSRPPVRLLEAWLAESYRAVAPRKLSALLAPDVRPAPPAPKARKTRKARA